MRKCVFLGPTLPFAQPLIGSDVDVFGPAHQGSVFRAVESGYQAIAIVDGYFGHGPSVWHKEILFALSKGIVVLGAASMGALRAAELARFGMIGLGYVYRLFHAGALTDDDEVCVTHAPSELGYGRISEALVDYRFTLRRLRRGALIDRSEESALLLALKSKHFSERTLIASASECSSIFGTERGSCISMVLRNNFISVKRVDAMRLLQSLLSIGERRSPEITWQFEETDHFTRQFRLELSQVPALR